MMADLHRSCKWGDLLISDETRDDPASGKSEYLEQRLKPILDNLSRRISSLAKDEYPSCCFHTPQRNEHVAYANGEVKHQGEAIRGIKCEDFSDDAKLAAFKIAADRTYDAIAHNKPEKRDRLIVRQLPDAKLTLKRDGLYVSIYVRIGWDKIEDAA